MSYTCGAELKEPLHLSDGEVRAIDAVAERYPMLITDYYFSLIDPGDPDDPIRKMSVPSPLEADEDGSFDTSGEQFNTMIPGLQHKYRETAMVLSTNRCAMYCRHCFRKRLVGLSDEEIARSFDAIMDYIRSHTEIHNVLISGGDSFLNSDAVLERYLRELTEMEHIDYIRFGTRTPVTWPQRITSELLCLLEKYGHKKQIYVVTQFNHPRELTAEAADAVKRLRRIGCVVRNQTVLMKGINDDPAVLAELLQSLAATGCTPYYIFQCRPVKGVKNSFQVPLRRGVEIVEQAKARQSGMGKSVKYCMSHPEGKLEILGHIGAHGLLLKFHEAKNPENLGRIFSMPVEENTCWLPENLGLAEDDSV